MANEPPFHATTHADRRFELVKMMSNIAVKQTFIANETKTADEIGTWSVAMADAVLTAMEKTPSDVLRLRLATIQTKLQDALTQNADAHAKNPTTDERVLGYREGDDVSIQMALRLIDEAMEPEAETNDG